MNKESIVKLLKNPWNVLFVILLIVTIIIYSKYQFTDSIWLDETHYMWEAQLTKENPLYFFKMTAYHLHVLIILFFNLFVKSFIAGRLMGLVFSIGALILVYIIGKQFRNGFTGFLAAFLLAYYHWWRFLTAKALVDIPVATLILLFAYLLYLFDKKKNWIRLVILIITGFFTLTVKASGLMIIALTIVYFFIKYVFFYREKKEIWIKIKNFFKIKKNIIIFVIVLAILILINKFLKILLAIIIGYTKNFRLTYTIQTLNLIINEFGWLIIIFALIGTITAIFYKSKEFMTIALAYGLFFFFAIFFYTSVPEIRYLFPLFPLVYLIAAYGVDEILNYIFMFIKRWEKYIKLGLQVIILIIIFVVVIKPNYVLGSQIIESRNYAYTGYIEAMNWVSDNIKTVGGEHKGIKNVYIPNFFACCGYNVGLDRDDIRRVNWSGLFNTFEEFKAFVEREDNINKTFYLMPDIWESGQRSWLYPMDQEKFNNIISLEFNLAKVVERPVPTQQGVQNIPVILIFKKN